MTPTGCMRIKNGPDARLDMSRAFLIFHETSKPKENLQKKWRLIHKIHESLPVCLGKLNGPCISLVNALYPRHFWNFTNGHHPNDLNTNQNTRGARVRETLPRTVFLRGTGRNFALIYWLTAKGNDQTQQLNAQIAKLIPCIEYPV